MPLAEVENMATLQLFTLGRSGGMFPQKVLMILVVLRCILVHSGAFWCILRHTEKHTELHEKRLNIKIYHCLLNY